ncbi:RNA polymerase sigma-70 factor, ECF subfamily [Chitinophaga sp. CF118]|uniref:RNA polymerase sigma factor n=1 Tax=Chitinophaga sp. CF118 TaxID=1884367 RepID=UPI0008F33A60|nr:sigma-70 family RNA polymerase sigma factor [Chitinophaga sp. CF118]SFD46779.1 RNA polymerase sigma-70 factor, ECF subfamily [Chitinophaga sp. CF118]
MPPFWANNTKGTLLEQDNLMDERELLRKVSASDETAFTVLFNNYYPLLSTHVFRITRSMPETEEIVQDVFFKIWMSRESLFNVENFKPYLWVIAKNQALNSLKKKARERNNQKTWLKNEYKSVADTGDSQLIYHSLIDEAISKLPPQQQKVFLLSRREGLKQAEIAAQMDLTLSTIKKYIQLATEFISNYIRERYHLIIPPLLLASLFF